MSRRDRWSFGTDRRAVREVLASASNALRAWWLMAKIVDRVVVFTQENHTTDNYFTSLRAWGANVVTGWPTQPNPPAHDQAHTRAAYAKWLHAQANGTATPQRTRSSTPT